MRPLKKAIEKLLACGVICTLALILVVPTFAADSNYYNESNRNQFHFSPEASWMNDPNGMVYYDGEYHLFYQNDPYSSKWGPMHWGHAVSKDLVHWEHLPVALYPDENGMIFSGSAVIDYNNTAGFGKEAMVAIFTHADGSKQVQSLAYSNDKGRTWKKYEGNPVMPNPPISDWRDPKVFWHDQSKKWVMTLAAKNDVMIYTSPNLKDWSYGSSFGVDPTSVQATSLDKDGSVLSKQTGSDFVYEADISVREKNGRKGSGELVFRSDSSLKNAYLAGLDAKSGKVTLSKLVDGKKIVLQEKKIKVMDEDSTKLRVETKKDFIKLSIGNKPVIKITDNSYESGNFGLYNRNAVSVFRNVFFKNATNFKTNILSWKAIDGKWESTMEGKVGNSNTNGNYVSSQVGDQFGYRANVKLNGKSARGGLLFRADKNGENGYIAQLDAGKGKVSLLKIENDRPTILAEKSISIDSNQVYDVSVYTNGSKIKVLIDNKEIIEQVDTTYESGHFGLTVSNSIVTFQDVIKENYIVAKEQNIANPDFESGSLEGWNVLDGDAFGAANVTKATSYWGGSFGQQDKYHLWGYTAEKGDDATGSIRSSYFTLGGSGEINFLIGGGYDKNLYVALVRASDNKELIRAENTKWAEDEKYRRVTWDASKYIGETVYMKVVDNKTGGWGHINVDDFHVYNQGSLPIVVDNDPTKADTPFVGKKKGLIKEWDFINGEWTEGTQGSYSGVWECPELIQVPVEGKSNKKKWVLSVSINDGAAAGGSGMQYFVGDFDGKKFTNNNSSDKVLWTDYGADFYAGVTWNNTGNKGKPLWLGWMSNWQYANDTPTSPWRSSTTVPRELSLVQTEKGLQLKQTPVQQLITLRDKAFKLSNQSIIPGKNLLKNVKGDTLEIEAELSANKASEVGFKVRNGNGQYTTIGYNPSNETVFIDRTHSGYDFGPNVKKIHEAPVQNTNGKVKLKFLLDRSSIEVFVNEGKQVLTDQIFSSPENQGVELYSLGGTAHLESLEMYTLKSIWGISPIVSNLSGWTTINGEWGDTREGKQGRSDSDSFIVASQTASDFTYKTEVKVLNEGAGALLFRADEKAENGYIATVDVRNDILKLFKIVDGKIEVLQEEHMVLNPNQTYKLKVTAKGSLIQTYLDDNLILEKSDTTFNNGRVGLNVWNSTTVFNHLSLETQNKK